MHPYFACIVLKTEVDAQCDKLAIDHCMYCRLSLTGSGLVSPEFDTQFQREVALFLEIPKFSYNTL